MPSSPASHRLPIHVQLYIAQLALHRGYNCGGVTIKESIRSLVNITLVCKAWLKETMSSRNHLRIIYSFLLRRPTGGTRKFQSEKILAMLERHSLRSSKSVADALELSNDCIDGNKWSDRKERGFTSSLRRIIETFVETRRLELSIENGNDSELAHKFPHLTHLALLSWDKPHQAIIAIRSYPVSPALSPFSSSLFRLDLFNILIQNWECTIPTLKVLTLEKVTLGQEKSTPASQDVCPNFLDSFPSLHSIAFNAVTIPYPLALTRLKVYGIKNLYLGSDCYLVQNMARTKWDQSGSRCVTSAMLRCTRTVKPDGRVESYSAPDLHQRKEPKQIPISAFLLDLARYFRCRIQHLWLPPFIFSYATSSELLSSRPGRPFPPYLAKLRTITYCQSTSETSEFEGNTMTPVEADDALQQSGSGNVETREWEESQVSEDDTKGMLRRWDPLPW
ncbi:hypothetical protein JCM5353_006065 [Sporobolomyces roseus]